MNKFTKLTPAQNKCVKYWQNISNGKINVDLYFQYLKRINTQPKTQFNTCQKNTKN